MATEAQRRAIKKYDEAQTVHVSLKLNRQTDADLIALLEKTDNKQGLIKAALRAWGINGG